MSTAVFEAFYALRAVARALDNELTAPTTIGDDRDYLTGLSTAVVLLTDHAAKLCYPPMTDAPQPD